MGYFLKANRIAKRCNRSILERANAIEFGAGLPGSYWELACICAKYLKNRSPSGDRDMISWEDWYSKRLSAKHYRVFGFPTYVQILKEKRKKLGNKKWKGVLVGYHEDTDRIWKIWDPIDKKRREAISVTFDEIFGNKSSEELLKSLADNSDQESDVETDTDSDLDDPKPALQIQQPISHLTSPLSSPLFSPLRPRSPTRPQLSEPTQTQLDRQNRGIAKATAKLQASQICEQQAADRGNRRNPQRN